MASSVSYLCLSHPLMPLKPLPAGERIYMEQISYKVRILLHPRFHLLMDVPTMKNLSEA